MAQYDELKISITASLDEKNSSEKIKKQLNEIAKHVGKIDISPEINATIGDALKSYSSSLRKINDLLNKQNEVYHIQTKIVKELDGTTHKVTEKLKRNNEIIREETTVVDKNKQAKKQANQEQIKDLETIEKRIARIGDLQKTIKRYNSDGEITSSTYKFRKNEVATSINKNRHGEITNITKTTDYEKVIKENKKLEQKLKDLSATGNLTTKQIEKLQEVLNQSINYRSLDLAKQKFKEMTDIHKLAEAMAKGREKAELDANKRQVESVEETNKAINKSIAERKRMEEEYNNWFRKQQERASKTLNNREQSYLNLNNKISMMSPDNPDVSKLNQRLNAYKSALDKFQNKIKIGIEVSDADLMKLKNAENALNRLHTTTKEKLKDAQGFDFSRFQKIDTDILSDSFKKSRKDFDYYNEALIKQHRLISANVQETEHYIKVTQKLRQGSEIKDLSVYINKATGDTYKLSEAQRDLMVRAYDTGSALKKAFEKMALWAVAGGIIFGVQNAMQSLLTTIVEIDTRLTEMSKVLSSNTNFDSLMESSSVLASSYGRSLTEAQDALVEFGKAGFEANEAIKLTNATLLGANVTGLKSAEMANYLSGALIQMNLSVEESTRVIDKMNEVDNNFSVTSVGLAQALNKAGESAETFSKLYAA